MGPNPTLTKTITAGGAITRRRIVKFGSSDATMVQASAATDALIGVAAELDIASGQRGDVHIAGLVEVEYGGSVTRGAYLTSDADGKAVAAELSAGSVVRILGQAMVSGVAGDIGTVMLNPTAAVGELGAIIGGLNGTPTITVGAQVSTTINVAIQLRDAANQDLAERASLLAYLSDDANGDSLATNAPDSVAIGTDGLAIPLVAGKCWLLTSEADGDIDLDITEDGEDTWYLVLVLPNGTRVVSDPITFAS